MFSDSQFTPFQKQETKDNVYTFIKFLKGNHLSGDREKPYIMIKGSIQEDIAIVNIHAPNIGVPKYRK